MKNFRALMMVLVVMAAAILPGASVVAQDPVQIDVWVAFDDYRLDWVNEVAAEFNAMFPQYNVVVAGGRSYETMFA
ncbi:MAG: ABC transporter substrate-binding protein, partial [Anaerolineae bacterium]|nr:ABC transporter substrate-binding protein [Anaerolineae bacterium]